MIGPMLSKIGGMETSFFSWMERTMLPSLSHSLKKGIPLPKTLFTSFFQTMSIPVLRPQTTSSLMFRDFLLGLEPLKRDALRPDRLKQPLDAGMRRATRCI